MTTEEVNPVKEIRIVRDWLAGLVEAFPNLQVIDRGLYLGQQTVADFVYRTETGELFEVEIKRLGEPS
jgi:hypothetical protein